jgi:FkbH-like protein
MATGNRQRLTESQLGNLGTLLEAIAAAEAETTEWRAGAYVHFLRNYTTEFTDPYLKFHLIRDDIRPTISHGGYDTVVQELLDPESPLCSEPPDVIVLSLLLEFLDSKQADAGWTADESIRRIDDMVQHVLDRTQSLLVLNTFLPAIDSLIAGDDTAPYGELERLNERVVAWEERGGGRIHITDFGATLRASGNAHALDGRLWVSSQAPFRHTFLNEYAKDIAYSVRVLKGRARKCLVLDCDNTIWGGVIGEDGMEGIELDDRSVPGVYFHEFQKAAVSLGEQGVMLAICSKNNEEDVWKVLDGHPHCALSKSHLVGWRINWENKAANLASLAAELNIGLDSFVFVDDSPYERALIGDMLPDVLVLPVPEDLSGYAGILAADRLFDTTARSEEDRKRTAMYQEEARRKEQLGQFDDLTDYLASLETVMHVFAVDADSMTRVTQLTQKTNQFNLTTRRYSIADIEGFAAGADSAVFAMSVADRHGEMGLTGVLIASREGNSATIDTLLLSCRVLGRQLEFAFVDQCLQRLSAEWGDVTWHADYLPTKKNIQVADFWDKLGFSAISGADGSKHYTLESAPTIPDYSRIISIEME